MSAMAMRSTAFSKAIVTGGEALLRMVGPNLGSRSAPRDFVAVTPVSRPAAASQNSRRREAFAWPQSRRSAGFAPRQPFGSEGVFGRHFRDRRAPGKPPTLLHFFVCRRATTLYPGDAFARQAA